MIATRALLRAAPRGLAANLSSSILRARAPIAALPLVRHSSDFSAQSAKVARVLKDEHKHEKEEYEQAKEIKKFLKETEFTFKDTEGDVNLMLEREMGDKLVRIEWQLSSPFDPDADNAGGEGEAD